MVVYFRNCPYFYLWEEPALVKKSNNHAVIISPKSLASSQKIVECGFHSLWSHPIMVNPIIEVSFV